MRRSGRVVVTGLGLVTPIGMDTSGFHESLMARRSGVRRIRAFDASAIPCQVGAEVENFDARSFLDKKDRKRLNQMVRSFQFAVAASQLALADARVEREKIDPLRFGVILGSGTVPGDMAELGPATQASLDYEKDCVDLARWGEKGLELIAPMWMLNHIPNMVSSHVSIVQNAQGPCNTITQTDAGGLLALGEAVRFLRDSRGDLFLVGGADMRINPVTLCRHSRFYTLTQRNDDPAAACRPFDRHRDGKALGEGGGLMLLESVEHAQERGAPIYAEVVGFASAFDRHRDGSGLAYAIRSALDQAGIAPDQVDHVNAHAVGDPQDDLWEANGIAAVFGDRTPVLALKGFFGDMGPGSAVLEMAGTLLGFRQGKLPATLNCDEPDPRCAIQVQREQRAMEKDYFVKISATELGQVAVALLKRWKD